MGDKLPQSGQAEPTLEALEQEVRELAKRFDARRRARLSGGAATGADSGSAPATGVEVLPAGKATEIAPPEPKEPPAPPAAQQTITIPYLRSVRPLHDLHGVLGAMRMDPGKNPWKRTPEFNTAIERFIKEHNERVGKQEWPASGIGALSDKSTITQVLNAARNELVERTKERLQNWEDPKAKGDTSRVQALQRGLKALGFYDGSISGANNKMLEEGIAAFKRNPYVPHATSREVVLLTGHAYEGRKAPTRYIPDGELANFAMPKESVAAHANANGWVGFMVAQEWGVNEKGASVAAGQIGFYNVNTGETRRFSMMTGGGSTKLGKSSANEWQKNASTPGLVQTDHVPADPLVNYVAEVKEHRTGRLKVRGFGFFTHLSNPYAGKTRGDDIGIHVDVGKLGSHGCPNIQAKDKAAFLEMVGRAKVKNFVILASEVANTPQLLQAPVLQRQGSLDGQVREQVALLELSDQIGRAHEAQHAPLPPVVVVATPDEAQRERV